MCVVVERIVDLATEAFVEVGVASDPGVPIHEFIGLGEAVVEQQERCFEVCGTLGQLFDRVAAIAEHAVRTVEIGDCRLGRRCCSEGRIEKPNARQKLAPFGAIDRSVFNRNLHRFAGSVVGNGDALAHIGSIVRDVLIGHKAPR